MCGLVGIAGDLNNVHEKVLKTLLVLDSLRGEDSTGVAFVSKFMDEVTVAKSLGDPFNLFNDGKFHKAQQRQNKVMLGHNRYATSGGVNKAGAHPFDYDTLVGAHNGTLGARYRLDDDRDFKVDSQALYHNIEKNGVKETIRRLGGQGNAWSLVWWDKIEKTLNFLRNQERPMHMCSSEDGKALFWASEAWMLDVALARHSIKHNEIFQTAVDTHLSVYINNKGELGKPKVVEVKADPVVVPVVQMYPHAKPKHIPKPQQQQSNVVVLTKDAQTPGEVGQAKKYEAVNPKGSASNTSYLSATIDRTFEILCEKRDANGGRYLSLFDANEPYIDIRLYPCKQDEVLFQLEGSDIQGRVTSFDSTDGGALRPYYKVSPWTVKYDATLAEANIPDVVMDHLGRLVTAKEWNKNYIACAWCSSGLNHLEDNRFTAGGDCLCPACAADEKVTENVTLI
jgi:predicted glutamine amidotransferase